MTTLHLLRNEIMAVPVASEKKKGLIIIPDKRNKRKDERPEKFEILAVGPDVRHIKPGMIILAGKYSGTQQRFLGNWYYFLAEDACHAILDEDYEVEEREHEPV